MKIKFITLNLWQGGNLLPQILEYVRGEDPDIIALQEVYDGIHVGLSDKYRTVEVFKQTKIFPYVFYSPAFLDTKPEGNISQGNAIFSKYPIIFGKTIFYDVPYGKRYENRTDEYPFNPRNLQRVVVRLKNQDLHVFNTQGIWGLDGGDNERRLKMSEIIANEIKDKQNVILAGDFNLRPNTKTIQNIEKKLVNIFKDELKTTFNIKRKAKFMEGYSKAVVDMIFTSTSMHIIDHYCPEVDISDHLPLVILFEIE